MRNPLELQIYNQAKPILDRLLGTWRVVSTLGKEWDLAEQLEISSDFCVLNIYSFRNENEVGFAPPGRQGRDSRLLVTQMQLALRDRCPGGCIGDQLSWLERHRYLFQGWCRPARFDELLRLSSADDADYLHMTLEYWHHDWVQPVLENVPLPDLAESRGAIIQLSRRDPRLAGIYARSSPYLAQILGQGFTLADITSGDTSVGFTVVGDAFQIRIEESLGEPSVSVAPVGTSLTEHWLNTDLDSLSMYRPFDFTIESKLFSVLQGTSDFCKICRKEEFPRFLELLGRMEQRNAQFRDLAASVE